MPYLGLEVVKPLKPPKKKDTYLFLKTSADQVVTNEETDERLDELILGFKAKLDEIEKKLADFNPVESLSGTVDFAVGANTHGQTFTKVVNFSPSFSKVPTVVVSVNNFPSYFTATVSEVTQSYCKINLTSAFYNDADTTINVSWAAEAKVLSD